MTTRPATPLPMDAATIRATTDALIHDFLDEREQEATELPELSVFTDLLRALLDSGGKRIRPTLCVIGWQAVSDNPPPTAVLRVAASLELFHAFAMIHDDIMDGSDTRHGRPTAHRVLTDRHADHPDAAAIGAGTAILLGDLVLCWTSDLLLLNGVGDLTPEQRSVAWPLLNALRTEAIVGQYLDLTATGRPSADTRSAWRIIRHKAVRYTVEHPLRLGAALAGASAEQLRALSAYAFPLGEAYQLRDDMLGVFGDPERTGKSITDDLRTAKHTVLVATALQHATPAEARTLTSLLGDSALDGTGARTIREILTSTGAVAAVERALRERYEQALCALTTPCLASVAVAELRRLAESVITRNT
ncbi:polyprenyl synthetase family protein [Streptomyces lushanensis]|uniref:polyprenyl synthetase family protein n=1 Tax=Streptomyces lushanensis TaxID=1434255 RepID=UPI000829BDDA|nr:polyprenyl synthetase family protein [Streptomyces lushanensis]